MRSSKVILSCLISVMLVATASATWHPITPKYTLGTIPDSLPVWDKEFSEFSLEVVQVNGGAYLPDPNTITVQGGWDSINSITYYGLRFNGFPWIVGSGQTIAVNLSFKVSILPGWDDYFIDGLWLKLTSAGATGTGVVSAGENVWDSQGNPVASLTCSAQAGDNGVNLLASAGFAPLKEIYIENKHLSVSGNANGTAYFGEFFQFYSQTHVPEPATLVLLGTAGIWIFTRKKRGN